MDLLLAIWPFLMVLRHKVALPEQKPGGRDAYATLDERTCRIGVNASNFRSLFGSLADTPGGGARWLLEWGCGMVTWSHQTAGELQQQVQSMSALQAKVAHSPAKKRPKRAAAAAASRKILQRALRACGR